MKPPEFGSTRHQQPYRQYGEEHPQPCDSESREIEFADENTNRAPGCIRSRDDGKIPSVAFARLVSQRQNAIRLAESLETGFWARHIVELQPGVSL